MTHPPGGGRPPTHLKPRPRPPRSHGHHDAARAEGWAESLMAGGAGLLPAGDDWADGWSANPLVRLVVRRHRWHFVGIYAAAFLVQTCIVWWTPAGGASAICFVSFFLLQLIATLAATTWHLARARPLLTVEILATPLRPAELLQALALPPWGMANALIVVFAALDSLWLAIASSRGTSWNPDAVIVNLVPYLLLHVLLVAFLLRAVRHIVRTSVINHITRAPSDAPVLRSIIQSALLVAGHVLLMLWPVWAILALGVLALIGVPVECCCLFALLAAILMIGTMFNQPGVVRPGTFEPYDETFEAWPALRGNDEQE